MERIWNVLPEPPVSFYEEHPALPKVVARLLYHRNLRSKDAIDEFLHPEYAKHVHDPFLYNDMKKAVARVFSAIEKQEKITVYGDYDADGVSSATVLVSSLRALGASDVDAFLPHRETDGYGLNSRCVDLLADEGTNLIITCDCGVSNRDEVARANERGVDVIITDHHAIPEVLPEAYAIIHPKVPGETYPDKGLCGAAVAFKLVQGLLHTHKASHELLANGEKHEAWEKWLLDMVAIASVADMVPLLGESRTLTKYGLIVLNKTKRIGLQKLLLEARIRNDDGTNKKELTAETIGFQIAPRINAAGRLNHANVAYNLMVTDNGIEATNLAFELDKNNKDRQKLTKTYVEEAIDQVVADQKDNPVLFVIGRDWSPGVVGLVASRLKEQYQKPTIAMAYHDGTLMGSGRSIEGFNMIASMQEIPEHFTKFGGHPMACGFTLASEDRLDGFKTALLAKYDEKTKDVDMRPRLDIDAEITLEEVNWDLFEVLSKFAPFGKDNPKPKYLAKGLTISQVDHLGKDGRHIKILATHTTPKIKKFVGWNFCSETREDNWCKLLQAGDMIDVVFDIGVNEWNGRRDLQMTIVDIKKA